MTPTKYRKKPVVIEAVRVELDLQDVARWCGGQVVWNAIGNPDGVKIKTLEGTMRADLGDWIIKGVQGEFYPCKPDIFEATYERAGVTEGDRDG